MYKSMTNFYPKQSALHNRPCSYSFAYSAPATNLLILCQKRAALMQSTKFYFSTYSYTKIIGIAPQHINDEWWEIFKL